MSCDCTGFEIQEAVEADGLAKTPNDLPAIDVADNLVLHAQDPLEGVDGSGKIPISEISKFILEKLVAEVIFTTETTLDYQCYRVNEITSNGQANFNFRIPPDFLEINNLFIVGVPLAAGSAGPGKSITLDSCYGGNGESTTIHTQTDNLVVDTGTQDVFFQLDLTSVFNAPGIAPNDNCGVTIDHNGVGGGIGYMDIVLDYKRIL